jgi:hypothetical protein
MNISVDVKELFHLRRPKLLNWKGAHIDKLTIFKKSPVLCGIRNCIAVLTNVHQ